MRNGLWLAAAAFAAAAAWTLSRRGRVAVGTAPRPAALHLEEDAVDRSVTQDIEPTLIDDPQAVRRWVDEGEPTR